MADWFVIRTHGNEFQMGLPDLYCSHFVHGVRWIEVKNPITYSFTPAQLEVFPKLSANNVGIWILTSDGVDEMNKIFQPPNWHLYLPIFNKKLKEYK